ncbi:hypothetical protein A0J61_00448 [Choanephora cucurbitarum]|uniref:Uncharacterized protein n=1 Tax=Choanephora cucurbitarum TaxID=101091 RepID=A0A1C7NRB0_9FUNG|nr:hypothetical protein A0J61_00448 [Choanephora cucurbitarum]
MVENNLNELVNTYQALRQIPGQVGGGEYDERVDSLDGEKYQVMKALGEQLGTADTPAANILSKLGKPDELVPTLDNGDASVQTMPGPMIPSEGAASQPPFYFVYNLRPKKDYLYFKIDPVKEVVISSGWHRSSE